MSLDSLKEIFIEETRDQMSTLENQLVEIEKSLKNDVVSKAQLSDLFRTIHSIKAGTGAMGYTNIMEYLHYFENVLGMLREEEIKLDSEIFKALYDVAGVLAQDIEDCISNDKDSPSRLDEAFIIQLKKIQNHNLSELIEDKNSVKKFKISFRPYVEMLTEGVEPLALFGQLNEIGKILECKSDVSDIPELKDYSADSLYLKWELLFETSRPVDDIINIFIFVFLKSDLSVEEIEEEKILVSIAPVAPAIDSASVITKNKSQSIRVDVQKLDDLVNIVGELVITQSRLQTLVSGLENGQERRNIIDRSNDLGRLIEELKDSVMNTRMVPVDGLFSQFNRTIKELSEKQNKEILLEIVGKETELDKNIIEKISDPLKHLIRNCVDHGIETPDVREANGKSRIAKVRLSAYQKEGSVLIEIMDDGRGLNKESILKKAIEKKIINPNQHLDDDEIYQLIFIPGFSTADQVTEISGRGVGMDVVKSTVTALNGHISIATSPGAGTTFSIKLPLTLAIIEGLLFNVGERVFVIPLLAVNETTHPTVEHIKTLEGKGEYLERRGKMAPIIRLHKLFNIPQAKEVVSQAMILHLTVNQKNYAVMIDKVIGHQQIVIKGLEQNFQRVEGFGGVTILGNGNVAPILDPNGIVSLYKGMRV